MSKRSSLSLVLAVLVPACTASRPAPEGQPGPMLALAPAEVGCMVRDSGTMAQMRVIHELAVNHARITRRVTNLPNGIRTVTESDDPRLASLIREHVVVMDQRVRDGDDPGLPMESSALRTIFREKDKILTFLEPTPNGVLLEQTSRDPAVAAALQQHATEVSDLAARGMAAMREARMTHGGAILAPGDCPAMPTGR